MSQFTFKTVKPTGKFRSFEATWYYIYNGKVMVGQFSSNDYSIRLRIAKDATHDDGNKNCSWMWTKLRYTPTSVEDAKRYLTAAGNYEKIVSQVNLITE